MIVVSCSKERVSGEGGSEIIIDASIEQSALSAKAVMTGPNFVNGNTMGIFIYYSEYPNNLTNFNLYGDKYRNIRATYNHQISGGWQYRFEGATSSTFDNIYLIDPKIETFTQGLTLKSYAPYIEGSTSISKIPFVTGGVAKDVIDLMWAEQNSDPEHSNARIVPDGNAKTVELTYKHAFALLKFGFRCKHQWVVGAEDGTTMKITSITLKKKDGGATPLYLSGNFNALTGEFCDDLVEGGSVVTDYSASNYSFHYNASEYVYVPFLIVPLDEYKEDGDYVLEFKFNNQTLSTEYKILRNDIRTGTEGSYEYSFKSGYTYTFNFTFNNYIQLDNVNISSDWEQENIDLLF